MYKRQGEDVPPTEKPAINADTELYQVEVMCEEEPAHYWSYPSAHGWNTTADQFTVGEIRANDLDNGTAEQYLSLIHIFCAGEKVKKLTKRPLLPSRDTM